MNPGSNMLADQTVFPSLPGLAQIPFQARLAKRKSKKDELPTINVWLIYFVLGTFFLQILLIPQQLFPYRTYLRIAMFGCSLSMLFLVPGRMKFLPISGLSFLIMIIYCCGLFHPETNSGKSATASIMLSFSIISPIFWVPRLMMDAKQFRFALILIWLFHAASSGLGILEVLYPDRFSRNSKITELVNANMVEGLQVTLADGTRVYRPMGFSDSPGGAAASGYLAVLLASGLFLTRTNIVLKAILLLSIVGGLFCIFLCQIRSLLILSAFCEIAMIGVFFLRGQISRVSTMLVLIPALCSVATIWAFTVGGSQVSDRVMSLTESSATDFYYSKRGKFLENTLTELLPLYPLGAGLGRWGMMHMYFGDKSSNASAPIWAEVQPTGWLLDGGVPLVLAYYAVILLCILYSFKMALRKKGPIADLSTIVLTLNLAILANTFSYIPFIGQAGLTFWLMNGCLMALTLTDLRMQLKKKKEQRRQIRGSLEQFEADAKKEQASSRLPVQI